MGSEYSAVIVQWGQSRMGSQHSGVKVQGCQSTVGYYTAKKLVGWSTVSKHPYNKMKKVFDILCMMAAFQHGDEEVNDGVP